MMSSQSETNKEESVKDVQTLDTLIGQLISTEEMLGTVDETEPRRTPSNEPGTTATGLVVTVEDEGWNVDSREEEEEQDDSAVKTTKSAEHQQVEEQVAKDQQVEEESEFIDKPSQLDNLLQEFNNSTQQWKEPSAFYKLTNRSTPALSSSKTCIQVPPPPLPTADDLGLEKLRLVDQAFCPPSQTTAAVTPTTPTSSTIAISATTATTNPIPINLHDPARVELVGKESLGLSHASITDEQQQAPASRNSAGFKAEPDGIIGQAYQPHPSQLPDHYHHHTAYHYQHHPSAHSPHPQQHSTQSNYLLRRHQHPSISSLNSAYSAANYLPSSTNGPSPSSLSSSSPNPLTLSNPAQHVGRPYYPEHHPGPGLASNGFGYRDNINLPANNPNPLLSHSQSLPRPIINSNSNQTGFPLSLQPSSSSSSSAPSPHQLALTRSGTSLSSSSSSHSNMLLAPHNPILHHPPPSRSPALLPPKTGPTISKASIDEYRNRIKSDPDPEAHFNYAKFLIEAARKLASGGAAGDDKAIKKYRDALLQESLKLIKKLATQGVGLGKPPYSDAQFFLANCLGNGSLGLGVDHEKAYNLYVQASKQNHPAATYRTAVCNELGAGTRKDSQRAVLFYRKASALGDTAGMYKLGMILLGGLLGQPKNPQEALLWLKRAAQQADEDNPHALHELAQIYEKPPLVTVGPAPTPNGKHANSTSGASTPQISYLVQRDEAYARELYTQAAQLGYPASQNRLGACYEYGALSCPIDPRRSIGWYTKAAERGDAESELALSGWYLTGSEGVLRQSDSEAYLWARRAASKGLPKAEYAVGYYAEVGIGVKQDIEEAKRWYMRAATNKNKRAMQRLTELKKMGSQKPAKRQARPTRDQAASECVIV